MSWAEAGFVGFGRHRFLWHWPFGGGFNSGGGGVFWLCSSDWRIVRWLRFSFRDEAEWIWWLRRAMEASNLVEAYNMGEWQRATLISLGVDRNQECALFVAARELLS